MSLVTRLRHKRKFLNIIMFKCNQIEKRFKRERGFSLLEVVVAVAIFALGAFAAGFLIVDGNTTTRLVIERNDAYLIAREGIEAVTSIRDAGFNSIPGDTNNHGLSNPTGLAWVFSGSSDSSQSGKYIRTVVFNKNPTSAPYTTTSSAAVTVTVLWTNAKGVPDTVSLSTILTDWRNQ